MAEAVVIKATEEWNVGDHIEAEGKRLEELLSQGIVKVLPGEESILEGITVNEPVLQTVLPKRGRPRKGVS